MLSSVARTKFNEDTACLVQHQDVFNIACCKLVTYDSSLPFILHTRSCANRAMGFSPVSPNPITSLPSILHPSPFLLPDPCPGTPSVLWPHPPCDIIFFYSSPKHHPAFLKICFPPNPKSQLPPGFTITSSTAPL